MTLCELGYELGDHMARRIAATLHRAIFASPSSGGHSIRKYKGRQNKEHTSQNEQ
jgi:hypothetical protein